MPLGSAVSFEQQMHCPKNEKMQLYIKIWIIYYFSLFKETLHEHDLLNKTSRIYTMDELAWLDARKLKRVALIGMKKIQGPATGK